MRETWKLSKPVQATTPSLGLASHERNPLSLLGEITRVGNSTRPSLLIESERCVCASCQKKTTWGRVVIGFWCFCCFDLKVLSFFGCTLELTSFAGMFFCATKIWFGFLDVVGHGRHKKHLIHWKNIEKTHLSRVIWNYTRSIFCSLKFHVENTSFRSIFGCFAMCGTDMVKNKNHLVSLCTTLWKMKMEQKYAKITSTEHIVFQTFIFRILLVCFC